MAVRTKLARAVFGPRCDHLWLPARVVKGWVIEECLRCGTPRIAP